MTETRAAMEIVGRGDEQRPCPCGRGLSLGECCLPLLRGHKDAETAEDLMRSRYTAHALRDASYLLKSWHVSRRPRELTSSSLHEIEWIRLEVHRASLGRQGDLEGVVEYTALGRSSAGLEWIHETARFTRDSGLWCYLDGRYHPAPKIGRNERCPCGSNLKYKRCCGR